MKIFIVLGTQRTGSSAIAEAVGTHPHIGCGWEWTQKIHPLLIPQVTQKSLFNTSFQGLNESNRTHAQGLLNKDLKCFGYRRLFRATDKWFFVPSLSPVQIIERLDWHLKWIIKNQISIIHVVRTNNLGWLKSKAITKETGCFVGGKYDLDAKATMDENEAVKRVRAKHWLDDKLTELQGKTDYIQVVYEEFCENNLLETQKIVQFLEQDTALIPSLEQKMKLKPQSRKLDQEILSNYSELEMLLEQKQLLTYQALKK